MVAVQERLDRERRATRMMLQVHDELLFDAPESEAEEVTQLVRQQMEGVIELSIPIVAEVGRGPNWRDAK